MFSIKLSDLAEKLGAKLYGNGDIIIFGISSIEMAQKGQITFCSRNQYRKQIASCQASAIVVRESDLSLCKIAALVVQDPYLSYVRMAQLLDLTPRPSKNIEVGCIIDPSVKLGNNVSIGSNSVIRSDVLLDDNVMIGAGCFIGEKTVIGKNTCILANVTIYHEVQIGCNCIIHSGTVVGSDGFGYFNHSGNWVKIPQLGSVIIGDKVEIGSSTTIDRGSLNSTFIGNGVIIDNQCQIAHNVVIGENSAIAGGVIIGGSSKIGFSCMIGGASVINGHLKICDNVIITGMSMVMRSITESGIYSSGIPLQSNKKWRKTAVLVMNIEEMDKRLKKVESHFKIKNLNIKKLL